MAYSGTRTFNLTIEEIIEEAFERCGLEVRAGYDLRTARRSLNLMFSEWANRGLNLWTIDYATTTMVAGTNYYALDQKKKEDIDEILNNCSYSSDFIASANDLQILDAISECYEEYRVVNRKKQ